LSVRWKAVLSEQLSLCVIKKSDYNAFREFAVSADPNTEIRDQRSKLKNFYYNINSDAREKTVFPKKKTCTKQEDVFD